METMKNNLRKRSKEKKSIDDSMNRKNSNNKNEKDEVKSKVENKNENEKNSNNKRNNKGNAKGTKIETDNNIKLPTFEITSSPEKVMGNQKKSNSIPDFNSLTPKSSSTDSNSQSYSSLIASDSDIEGSIIYEAPPKLEQDLSPSLDHLKSSKLNEKHHHGHSHSHNHNGGPRSLLSFRRVYFIFGIVIGACTIYLATLKIEDVRDMTGMFKNVISDLGMTDYLSSDFISSMSKIVGENLTEDDNFLPGRDLVEKYNLTAKYPIFIIPGITSCGLETWMDPNSHSQKCSETYFRKRMWGTLNMPKAILLDRKCWIEHMMLDPITGLDPSGFKLRASAGLTAADYLFPGYWVWGKVIANLGTLGYDSNNLIFNSYDWRLSMRNTEVRDGYFTDLKMSIEKVSKIQKEKVVIITHSMGFNLFYYFLNWVESPEGGNGGKDWVNKYIKIYINVAGTALGVTKSVSALLSGETKDTAQLGTFLSYVLEKLLSMKERVTIFRNYGSISSMLPKGGNRIWGFPKKRAPGQSKESFKKYGSYSSIINIHKMGKNITNPENESIPESSKKDQELYGDDIIQYLKSVSDENYKHMLDKEYSHGIAFTEEQIEENKKDSSKWINPLEVSLPYAPDMNIYCLYGINKPTEKRYYYNQDESQLSKKTASVGDDYEHPIDLNENLGFAINQTYNVPEENIQTGIQFDNGDGTVPLVSLGYMCKGGWNKKRYNPANIKVTTREYKHNPFLMWVRGGPETADHVDILGNHDLLKDILFIVSGNEDLVEERIDSNLMDIIDEIDIDNE